MRLSLSMKVGLASMFSCLALLLGQLSSTSMASAHTANHSSTTSCPKGTVSSIRYVNEEGPQFFCADPANVSSTNSGSTIYYYHMDK